MFKFIDKIKTKKINKSITNKIDMYNKEAPCYFTPAEVYTLVVQANIIKPVIRKLRKAKYQWCIRNVMIAVNNGNIVIIRK